MTITFQKYLSVLIVQLAFAGLPGPETLQNSKNKFLNVRHVMTKNFNRGEHAAGITNHAFPSSF